MESTHPFTVYCEEIVNAANRDQAPYSRGLHEHAQRHYPAASVADCHRQGFDHFLRRMPVSASRTRNEGASHNGVYNAAALQLPLSPACP